MRFFVAFVLSGALMCSVTLALFDAEAEDALLTFGDESAYGVFLDAVGTRVIERIMPERGLESAEVCGRCRNDPVAP